MDDVFDVSNILYFLILLISFKSKRSCIIAVCACMGREENK